MFSADAYTPFVSMLANHFKVGLTGGIGSGKSTVATCLVNLGAHLVDADAISKSLTAPQGAALPAIAERFGKDMLNCDGALDRDKMRALVFKDPNAKQELEHILHPLIWVGCWEWAQQARPRQGIVFDIPLLTESSHWRSSVDKVLVIDCSASTQIARVTQRPGWTADAAKAVIAQQASRQDRLAIADAVILNEDISLDTLTQKVQTLWREWMPNT